MKLGMPLKESLYPGEFALAPWEQQPSADADFGCGNKEPAACP